MHCTLGFFCYAMMTMLFLSLCGVGLLFIYSQLVDRRLPYQKAYWHFEICHLLAGLFVAAGAAAVAPNIWVVFGITMAVGILWEVWEFMLERPFLSRVFDKMGWRHGPWTLPDTILDLLLDAGGAGAFLALSYWA